MTGQCKGTTAAGKPCRSPLVDPETGYCAAHGPGASARMAERGAKGARATAKKLKGKGVVKPGEAPPPPETVEDAKHYASWAMDAVATGRLDYRVGNVIQGLCREFRSATKEAALEAEVAELREVVATLKAKNKGGTR